MPRPTLPPTPGSSTDIKGKEGPQLGTLQMAFELPPPAITGSDSRTSSISAKSSSASSYHPTSPKSPAVEKKSSAAPRRRFSAEKAAKDVFTLPPPPTRSRKIIQMKPRAQAEEKADENKNTNETKEVGGSKASTQSKRKPPSASSVAGRKIARKTAHSLIERRRRSKMNEEFGVLKDMIPACTGEMHKLAILQASIDYVRYLEDCVAKLKAQSTRRTPTPTSEHAHMPPPPGAREMYNPNYASYDEDDEDEASDVEMDGTTYPAPHSHHPSASPAIPPQDSTQRNNSYSSASASASTSIDSRHYSYSTSPNFGPQNYEYAISSTSANSALTSPALLPQREDGVKSGIFGRDLDQEATSALLMLNTDRRGTNGGGGRGMSVKDLLSA